MTGQVVPITATKLGNHSFRAPRIAAYLNLDTVCRRGISQAAVYRGWQFEIWEKVVS
jgi:hypothetical protein